MKEQILKLRKEGKTYKEIVEKVGCSKGTVAYHCGKGQKEKASKRQKTLKDRKKKSIKTPDSIIKKMQPLYNSGLTAQQVADELKVSKTTVLKYIKVREQLTVEEKRKNNIRYVNKRRKELKIMSIEYKGGKCSNCGYNRCVRALDFHHLDPSKKNFTIASKGYTRSWKKVKEELDKCVLVCANCHREIHEGLIKI